MTVWNLTFINYKDEQYVETTVHNAPDRESALIGACDRAPNMHYDIVVVEYLYLH